MKGLILSLAVLSTLTANAGRFPTVGDSLESIRSNVNAVIEGSVFLGNVRLAPDAVCVEGESFKSLEKYKQYKREYVGKSQDRLDGFQDGWITVLDKVDYYVGPISYTNTFCAPGNTAQENEDDVCRVVNQEIEQATTRTLNVYKAKHARTKEELKDRSKAFLFSLDYKIEDCK